MLALRNKDGEIFASVGGLAHQARVTKEKTAEALAKFLSPEEDSSSRDDGRRINEIPGGWRLLNHERVKLEAQAANKTSYMATYMAEKRAKEKVGKKPETLRAKVRREAAEDPTTRADAKEGRRLNNLPAPTKEPTTAQKEYDLDDAGDTAP